MTSCARSNVGPMFLVTEKLNGRISYSFIILSSNSIGQQTTAAVQFCKKFFSLR